MHRNDFFEVTDKIIRKNRITLRSSLLLMIVVIFAVLVGSRIFVIVRSGQMGVIWNFFSGTDKDTILTEGINFISPLNNVFLYDTRVLSIDKIYNLQTKEGLEVQVGVNIRVRPDIRALPALHQIIGPNYVDKVVIPQIEAVVRRIVGQYTAEEIYTSSRGLNEAVLVSSIEALNSRFILVDRVLIKSFTLPQTIQKAIENKLVLEQESLSYKFKIDIAEQEAQRQIIEAQGTNQSQKIVGETLSNDLLRWHGILATKELAKSPNAKTLIYGAGKDGLPFIMNEKQ